MLMTTRRAAIGGAVSAIAVTPVLIGPPLASTVDADAELVRLSAQFEPLFAEWLENERLCREHIAVFEAAVERVTGVPSREAFWRLGHDQKYRDARTSVAVSEDPDPSDGKLEAVADPLWDLTYGILAIRPATIAGLGIQARAVAFANFELWWDAAEISPDDLRVKTLIENVLALAGLPGPQQSAV